MSVNIERTPVKKRRRHIDCAQNTERSDMECDRCENLREDTTSVVDYDVNELVDTGDDDTQLAGFLPGRNARSKCTTNNNLNEQEGNGITVSGRDMETGNMDYGYV